MTLQDRAADLFQALLAEQSGIFILKTPARTISLELSGSQILGVEGMPELLSGLAELSGLDLTGSLALDLNLSLTQGVPYEQAARVAARNLGRTLVRQLSHPHAETSFHLAEPSPSAWPLQRTLVHIVRETLRKERPPSRIAQLLSHHMGTPILRTGLPSEPFVLDPIARRTLDSLRSGWTLGELILHSGRGIPSRTRAAWTAVDLLFHLGLLSFSEESAAGEEETSTEASAVGDESTKEAPELRAEAEDLDELEDASEDENDPFGLFTDDLDRVLTPSSSSENDEEFIWADQNHGSESWAQVVAQRIVTVPEVSLAELQKLPERFRHMNPLEVLGLEPGSTVSLSTIHEAYEQRTAQFDPEGWKGSGQQAQRWAQAARDEVSEAYRELQTRGDIEEHAACWRTGEDEDEDYEDADTAPLDP